MTLSTLVEVDWLLTPPAARSLERTASSVGIWQQAIETILVQLRGLLDAEKHLCPQVDVDLIAEPFSFVIDSSSTIRDVAISPADIYQQIVDEPGASRPDQSGRARAWCSLPEAWRSDYAASRPVSSPLQRTTPDGSLSDVETGGQRPTSSNLKSQARLSNSVQLLLILQRYAGRLNDLSWSRRLASKSREIPVSLNVKLNVEKLEKLNSPDTRLPTRSPTLPPGKKLTPFLVEKGPGAGGSSSHGERTSAGSLPGPLDQLGRQALRKLESWFGEGTTTNVPSVKIDSSRRVGFGAILQKDKALPDQKKTINPSRLVLAPLTQQRRIAPSNKTSDSFEANDFGRESLRPSRIGIPENIAGGRAAERAPETKSARPVWNHLAETLQSTRPESAGRSGDGRLLDQPAIVIQTLERIVEKLVNIETKYVELAADARQDAADAEPAIDWLNEEDLAARLQTILKRQARRRGIDLS